jgi:hypothetical protein
VIRFLPAIVMALVIPTCLIGCGGSERPSLVKATGTVTLDGKPLEGAIVGFQPVTDAKAKYQRPSSAVTDAAGKFQLGTYGKDDGVPVGKYKVGVQKRELVGELPQDYNSENPNAYNLSYKWITPRSAADPAASGLEINVTSSGLSPAVIELKALPEPEIELTGPQRRANEP